jgi:hypothetical protein
MIREILQNGGEGGTCHKKGAVPRRLKPLLEFILWLDRSAEALRHPKGKTANSSHAFGALRNDKS